MGTLIVISAPSGAGKNTVIRRLLELFPSSTRLVTTTTRQPRSQEVEGKDYFFVSKHVFESMIEEKKFVEHNVYAGEYYGTEKEKLDRALEEFEKVFVALDVNGKHALDEQKIPHVSIFLLPESLEILKDRIVGRGSVDGEALEKRLTEASKEMEWAPEYDFQVVNPQGNINQAIEGIIGFLSPEAQA